ncbi:MAG: hypothetical protein LBP21_03125 [Synergistaceae bacterium]|jgi:hypothetical protein|nr:hypothetical protein [Synergistaceae bacterium]
MSGWLFHVTKATPKNKRNRDLAVSKKLKKSSLAYWHVGTGGLQWLKDLVAAGKAKFSKQVESDYWYGVYKALARDVLPLIQDGPPPHVSPALSFRAENGEKSSKKSVPANWTDNVFLNRDNMDACTADSQLVIFAVPLTDRPEMPWSEDRKDDETFYGWSIEIKIDEYKPDPETLARWENTVSSRGWLDKLVEAGKAALDSHGGYPDRYRALAGDVLPLIADNDFEPRVSVVFEWHRDVMAKCPRDQALIIDVWDIS